MPIRPQPSSPGRRTAAAGAVLLAALVAAGTSGGAASLAKSFTLSITGGAGTRYSGRCTLATAAGREETIELSGVVPREERLEGEGLTCRIEGDGPLVVEVAGGGSRTRSATSGGTVHISLR